MGAYSFSGTAASNTTVDGIGAAGSDSPDNIDNLVRALAASDANLVRDLGGANTVAGSADAITVALADASTPTYFDGMTFSFRAASDTTSTTPTLNVDSLGAKTIVKTVQGAETALIAGDIQAGQTCNVVYRSAFAAAAGAFELLNPSIASSIELGHATNTTLTQSSAGVVAVEGVQLQRVVYPTHQSAASTAVDFTGIPSWVREIEIALSGISFNGADNIYIQIGDSGGFETTGYDSTMGEIFNTNQAVATAITTAFPLRLGNAARLWHGTARIVNVTANLWVFSGVGSSPSPLAFLSSGNKTLSDTLTQVRITGSAGGSFDAGTFSVIYRG
jgi:hypothetical protein